MPVYSSHLLDYAGLGVCARIRQRRHAKGLTLRQLAARVKLSPAQLSKIENGKAPLDLAQLSAFSSVLGVAVNDLFPPRREFPYLITRRSELARQRPTTRELIGPEPGPLRHHNPVWPLSDAFVGKHMEPVVADIHPLADKDLHFIAHDHEEFMFVLAGEVESLIHTDEGVVREHLEAGDCMYFRWYLPHCHRSSGDRPARTVNLMYSLRGAIDSDDGELGPSGHQFYRRGVHKNLVKEAAERIALLRRARGLTLATLAASVGIPVRTLRQIENGTRAVSLEVLLNLARKFRRPIEYFLSATMEDFPPHFVQRRSTVVAAPARRRRLAGDAYRPLASGFPNRGMHPYYVQVTSDASDTLIPIEHHGQEFIFVLDGEVELVTWLGDGQQREILTTGDAVFLESSVPHALRGRSLNPYAATHAEIVAVFWSPLGEEHVFDARSDTAAVDT